MISITITASTYGELKQKAFEVLELSPAKQMAFEFEKQAGVVNLTKAEEENVKANIAEEKKPEGTIASLAMLSSAEQKAKRVRRTKAELEAAKKVPAKVAVMAEAEEDEEDFGNDEVEGISDLIADNSSEVEEQDLVEEDKTIADCMNIMKQILAKKSVPVARELLGKFSVARAGDLDIKQCNAFYAEGVKLINS